jgi:hypothetical protein
MNEEITDLNVNDKFFKAAQVLIHVLFFMKTKKVCISILQNIVQRNKAVQTSLQ